MSLPHVVVIGSLNVDFVTVTNRVPSGGETIHAVSHAINYGGKGANQASACARLSRSRDVGKIVANVSMIGNVGTIDAQVSCGLLDSLTAVGCSVDGVRRLQGEGTGTATILVEEQTGENRILVVPAANARFLPDADLVPSNSDVVLFQHEIPLPTVIHNIQLAKRKGAQVMHNPAPAIPLPLDVYKCIDHLIMNSSEALLLHQSLQKETPVAPQHAEPQQQQPEPDSLDEPALNEITADFITAGTEHVVVTLGSRGCFYQTASRLGSARPGRFVAAEKVDKVVDTTGAGDAFVGAYAIRVAQAVAERRGTDGGVPGGKLPLSDDSLDDAVRFAVRVSARSVQTAGARDGVPWMDEISSP